MTMRFFVAMAIGLSGAVLAQAPNSPDGQGESSVPMTPERKCDALTGENKAQCLRDAQRIPESTARAPALRGSCDALIGPDKELCLKRGGTVEADAKAK